MTTSDPNAFANSMAGLGFMPHLASLAGAGPGPAGLPNIPGMPPMGHWMVPTLDVDEIERRIQDLRTVHFWLEQNTKVLAASIQALEVQKLTAVALKSMNVSMQDLTETFKMQAQPQDSAAQDDAAGTPGAKTAAADAMHWWSALTQQFQNIVAASMNDMAQQAAQTTEPMTQAEPASSSDAQATAQTSDAPSASRSSSKRAATSKRQAPSKKSGLQP